jgi:hypothetical protein
MAFIDVNELESEPELKISHILTIDILEPVAGKMALFLPYECKRSIVENIYGEKIGDLKNEKIDDCQLEILNVLIGNVLSFYYGGKKKYKVDLPMILFDESEIHWNKKETHTFYFEAEGNAFKLVTELAQ